MKGEEEILPLTKITTRYDNNNQIITEVTEDYDKNEVKITIPLYYLFGLTEKPTQLPELQTGNYQIQIYNLDTASTPISTIQIKANDMPFVLKFYHHDHLGTVRYITNESGEILHTTDTLAYGEELTAPYEDSNDKVLNTITYTGHEKDYETNLTYMLARYYSQGYGRFLSPDSGYDYDQLDPMSWNLYSYVRGNPIRMIDRTGMSAEEVQAIILAMHRMFEKELKETLNDPSHEERGFILQKTGEGIYTRLGGIKKGKNGQSVELTFDKKYLSVVVGMFHTHPDEGIFSITDLMSINDLYRKSSNIRYSILYNKEGKIYAIEMKEGKGIAPAKLKKLRKKFRDLADTKGITNEKMKQELMKTFKELKKQIILYEITVTEKDGKLLINVKAINQD